ncbi:Transcription elongation factor B polypeptide 1 [Orchesella cincta]|uniref:Elongin-C n=2 Tax=Orchesella TaxID=48705 RepID=A0A1D2NEN5_ORCCI|nr:Transcription elongation factor B polypeptide 1 [Orchesella cincta]
MSSTMPTSENMDVDKVEVEKEGSDTLIKMGKSKKKKKGVDYAALAEAQLDAAASKRMTMAAAEEAEVDDLSKKYGGCEGPDAMYVKLISSDGHEFIVKREHALTSGTIKAMLSGPGQFAENETNEVNFREIPSHVLQKVCMFFTYKVRYTNSSTEIPEFPIAPEIALELLMAANFLDC